ncbi:uncharacterized protein LOC129748135 isoform X2 [Uranotaenia lowii]|uniref:uncharacterized protein LOC129748135 isoform X2 n=1 Tax=Uranotaenia lowii TaxID=190385 RepID=UPI002478F4C5|nr:uncharacterized protein LOC129748135 isoform X2 [Uranotaenia lowii]
MELKQIRVCSSSQIVLLLCALSYGLAFPTEKEETYVASTEKEETINVASTEKQEPNVAQNSAKSITASGQETQTARSNRKETYDKVMQLVGDIQSKETNSIDDTHLRTEVQNAIQERLKNPIADVVGNIGYFSKVQDCFKTLADAVKGAVDEVKKTYDDCRKNKENSIASCLNPASATLRLKMEPMNTNIQTCMQSNSSS